MGRIGGSQAKRLNLEAQLADVLDHLPATGWAADAQTLAHRFHRHWSDWFTFLSVPEVKPDNNDAERALRPVVIHRKTSGGARSAWGGQLVSLMFSFPETVRLQGKHAVAELFNLRAGVERSPPQLLTNYEITSERAIQRKRNAIRPDISIWRDSELLAVIECKTQLGWSRHNWKADFEDREKKLKEVFPNAKIFLVVMSSRNWSGFGDDLKVGERLFYLLNVWPTELSISPSPSMLHTPIEKLFEQLVELRASTSSVTV